MTSKTAKDEEPPAERSTVVRRPSSAAEALHTAAHTLSAAGADAPRLTAEVLLAQVLGLSRTQALTRPAHRLSPEQQARYAALTARAAQGEPLAYLTGRREFHGLDFQVDRRVLVPRPETELLVDAVLADLAGRPEPAPWVLEVGTGSGCIAVTVAVKHPAARVIASDLDADALRVARANAARHGVAGRLAFLQADLLAGLGRPPGGFHLLCANLPYIPAAELAGLPVARHEPRRALDGGPDGLALVRRLLAEAPRVMHPAGRLWLEIAAGQGSAARAAAQAAFPQARVAVQTDLAGLDRLVVIHR